MKVRSEVFQNLSPLHVGGGPNLPKNYYTQKDHTLTTTSKKNFFIMVINISNQGLSVQLLLNFVQ